MATISGELFDRLRRLNESGQHVEVSADEAELLGAFDEPALNDSDVEAEPDSE